MSRLIMLLTLISTSVTSCGARNPMVSSELKASYEIPLEEENRVNAVELRKKLWTMWNSASATEQIPATDLLAVIPMAEDQRSIIAADYATPLSVNCTVKPCVISGRGNATTAATNVSLYGISNPYLNVASSISATLKFSGADKFTICNVSGLAVQKLFITWPVLAIESVYQGTDVSVHADLRSKSGTFDCK